MNKNRFEFRLWNERDKYMVYFPNPVYDNVYFDGLPWNDENTTPMQYVGIKDIKGKKIFEGDLVRKIINRGGTKSFDPYIGSPFEVKWEQQHCGFGITVGNNHVYEVVGNIFENPELLK